jgi:hypothetical protein
MQQGVEQLRHSRSLAALLSTAILLTHTVGANLSLVTCSAAFKPARANAPRRLVTVRPKVTPGLTTASKGRGVIVCDTSCSGSITEHCLYSSWLLHSVETTMAVSTSTRICLQHDNIADAELPA